MRTVSVAIPCYRSADTIVPVVEEIIQTVAARKDWDYQIILVNDYPYDSTFDVIRSLCERDARIIGVNLTKNYGQNHAKLAAIPFFTGDVLIFMDDDGQHPACDLFKLVDKIDEGYDLVYAHFPHKRHNLFKLLTSYGYAKVQEFNHAKPKGLYISSFFALSKTAAQSLLNYKSPFPSIGGYLCQIIKNAANVDMEHRRRIAGESHYTLRRMLRLWLDSFTNFSLVPLRFIAIMGSFIAVAGFVFGLITIIRKLIHPNIPAGYTSSIALILFIGGLIIINLGVIGEYIGRIYMTISNMPQFCIREVINKKRSNEDNAQ